LKDARKILLVNQAAMIGLLKRQNSSAAMKTADHELKQTVENRKDRFPALDKNPRAKRA